MAGGGGGGDLAQLVGCVPGVHEALGLTSPLPRVIIVGMHAFNPSTLEMEVGEVQGHSRLGVELKTSLGCLKKKKKNLVQFGDGS